MPDQAYKLRHLIKSASPVPAAAAPGTPMIVVAGGRPGVGATTVAVNLAAVLADRGERVVLVDAAQDDSNVAQVAGVTAAIDRTMAEVLSGSCTAAEALAPGPAGTLVLANRPGSRVSLDVSRSAQHRLFGALQSLQHEADVLVVDAGRGLTTWTRRFWLRARMVVLVTGTDDIALMDAYALIKRCTADRIQVDVRVLANRCESGARASEIYGRLSGACHRFLSRKVGILPALPALQTDEDAGTRRVPRVWESPDSPFGHATLWMGRAVSDALESVEPTRETRMCEFPARVPLLAGQGTSIS